MIGTACAHTGITKRDIRQVRATGVRIVQHGDVAGAQVQGVQGGGNGHWHRTQMHGHVVSHRHHAGPPIENSAGIIAAFLDVG